MSWLDPGRLEAAEGEQPKAKVAQEWHPLDQLRCQWSLCSSRRISERLLLSQRLKALSEPGWPLPFALDGGQVPLAYVASLESRADNIRGHHRILNCEIDAHATGWRHHVRGIADNQQASPKPAAHATGFNRQYRRLRPILEVGCPFSEPRHTLADCLPDRIQTGSAQTLITTL